jgi:molybdopterin synthase catalytic subunit
MAADRKTTWNPAAPVSVRIQTGDFDISSEINALTGGRADIGAVVSFTGLCRDEGGRLSALELEHYPGMAERAIRAIAEEAVARFSLSGITAIHRYGKICRAATSCWWWQPRRTGRRPSMAPHS